MEFNYAYKGSSHIADRSDRTDMSFSPDTKREPTFFRGQLDRRIPFREAISALHDVVISDLRWKPKDRTEYKEWLAKQEELDWSVIAEQRGQVAAQVKELSDELADLNRRRATRWSGYYKAQRRYFDYLYRKDMDAWYVLDPVITVHPDEIFFECFSQDESTYGRLGTSYEVYKQIGEFACGTTNIDYSQTLYDEFQKIRSYKETSLEVDPSGFEVQTTHEESYKEVKIDLPDTWVRGFLQVSSAMSLPAESFELHPMDVYNMCLLLRRNKELVGPRSMRFCLQPDQPVRIVFEPWGHVVTCPRSIYQGQTPSEIRVWGRRRIHILERLIPIARSFTVHLLGTGMPSFYVADLGHMSFTLGLSGWTANDWATAGNFDLMAPRAEVDEVTKRRVFTALKENWVEDIDALSQRLGLERAVVLGALSAYTQAGRAIYDLNKQVYRVRELSREPLPMDKLRFANEREESATRLLTSGQVQVSTRQLEDGAVEITGVVGPRKRSFNPVIVLDTDQRMIKGTCSCNFYQQNKLYKGPCEHMLAARMAFARGGGADSIRAPLPQAQVRRRRGRGASSRSQSSSSSSSSSVSGRQSSPQAPPQPSSQSSVPSVVRRVVNRLTGRGERDRRPSAQLADVALDTAMRELVDRGLVEVAPRRRDELIEEMLQATFRATGLDSAVDLAMGALVNSDIPEEVWGDDDELRGILQKAFEDIARNEDQGDDQNDES